MRVLFLISSMFLFCCVAIGQDAAFSQYFNLNTLINPASVGNVPENINLTVAYRNQWGTVSSPFITNLFSAEFNPQKQGKNTAGRRVKSKRSKLCFGILAFTEKAGTSGYKASTLRGISSYHFKLTRYKELSFGLELGYNQRSFSLDGLAWDAQFNGVGYNPALPSQESFSEPNTGNIDTGFGVEFRNLNPKKFIWYAGMGVHHYYQQQTVLENGVDLLPTLSHIYFKGQNSLNNMMYRYYAIISSQDLGALTGTIGMDASYRFDYDSKYTSFSTSSALTLGGFYRYRDAIIALIGYEYKRIFRLSFSYDVNVSSLRNASSFNGGPEINLSYLHTFGKNRRKFR